MPNRSKGKDKYVLDLRPHGFQCGSPGDDLIDHSIERLFMSIGRLEYTVIFEIREQ